AVGRSPGSTFTSAWPLEMAYDAARQRVVLWYGSTTYEYDGVTWTVMRPRHSPSYRYYPGFTYDAARHRVVMFGGQYSSSYFNETWEWDGNDWTQLQPTF